MAHDSPAADTGPMIYVVDDDEAVRDSLRLLFRSVGLAVKIYSDAQSFLADETRHRPACLVCDVRMPGLTGLQLQERLEAEGRSLPIIFMSGHGDVQMAIDAMRKGAVDFLQKPFNDEDLLARVDHALQTR